MIGEEWTVEIQGAVSYLDDKNRRIRAPRGTYKMTERKGLIFEVTRTEGPTFHLTGKEVAHYVSGKEMKIPKGWP